MMENKEACKTLQYKNFMPSMKYVDNKDQLKPGFQTSDNKAQNLNSKRHFQKTGNMKEEGNKKGTENLFF